MRGTHIVALEGAVLHGERPRIAGSNARLDVHGRGVRVPLLRITDSEGARGFGACHVGPDQLQALVGVSLDALFDREQGIPEPWRPFEYPIWDLVGQRTSCPVYALAAATVGRTVEVPFQVPCYDTSLYFDDLHLPTDEAAAEQIAQEAREGYERGHRAFKIKVGRGARHLPLEVGTRRDIAVVRRVRAAVGRQPRIMLDANNGYNLNLAKHVLQETADCGIFWLEEAFHEDNVLYADLKAWLTSHRLPVLIADGEGQADPRLVTWAHAGLVDVIQYDIFGYGLTRWLALSRDLDRVGVRSAPHHYGGHFGNYAACHLAGAVQHFAFVEWDEATTPGLGTSGYVVDEGQVNVPDRPGFGLDLDEELFQHAVATDGIRFTL